jgi:hypothetical protein
MTSERGGIITGWLLKLVISLAIFGLVAFEAGAIVVAKVTIEDIAGDAVGAAAHEYGTTKSQDAAEKAAREVAESKGAVLEAFSVVENGRAVVVTVSKPAKTLFLHRIGVTKDWAVASSTRRRGVG